jgi:hypothetical protein
MDEHTFARLTTATELQANAFEPQTSNRRRTRSKIAAS